MELAFTLIVLGLLAWWFIAKSIKQEKLTQERRDKCQKLLNRAFPEVQNYQETWWGTDAKSFTLMRICDIEGDVYFAYIADPRAEKYLKKYILSSEVIEDGQSIASARRASQVAWGMAGGLVAGAPGALIGGLGTAHKTKDYVNSIVLRVGFIDPSRPVREIPFLPFRVKARSPQHITSRNNALEWHNRFQASMRKADWAAQEPAAEVDQYQAESGNPQISNALAAGNSQTITRLAELYQEGLLTREEFEIEKRKIINAE